ncbi:MAG: tryptophan 2,3-dioxygenase family protein [Pseudomonadota bacterium]
MTDSSPPDNGEAPPELEAGIERDLRDRLTYTGYLRLDLLLNAQLPLSEPQHHDEMLFIVQHQVSELWMKLILHELDAAIAHVAADTPGPALKNLSRVVQVQRQLFNQWAVLETLTPSEYTEFRTVLGNSSGFQSAQFRALEFVLGRKRAAYLDVFRHDGPTHADLSARLAAPSLYDVYLHYLARRGHAIPEEVLERDLTQTHQGDSRVVDVLENVYGARDKHWEAYEMSEKLVDVEHHFSLWRFRHMKTVERIIGFKRGTGGSSGVQYLRTGVDMRLFPELIDVRTRL